MEQEKESGMSNKNWILYQNHLKHSLLVNYFEKLNFSYRIYEFSLFDLLNRAFLI